MKGSKRENILLYLNLPIIWAQDGCIWLRKKTKPAIAMLMAAALLVSLMPLTAFAMQVFIRVNVDAGTAYYDFEVEPTDRVEDFKVKIYDRTGISWSDQILTYNGTVLEDSEPLQAYNIQKDSIIYLTLAHQNHPVCGDSACTDTSHAADNWTAWDGTGTFPGGNVYLTDDVTLTSALTISGTVNLCLNGHTIRAAGGYFVVGGTLNLCSCAAGGSIIRTSTTEALICADGGATANLYNVTLDGGAVWSGTEDVVLGRGTTNSGISSSAPLIDAGYQRTAGGHITLGSGVVLKNNVCSGAGHGGAVTIGEDGTLVINGATVCNNAKTDGNAGAIKAYAGAQITVNSGEIYGNEAYKHGGAVQIFGGDSTDYATAVFTMNGGTIRNNKADGVGGAIAVSNYSKFVMTGGSITDNATTDSSKCGGGVGFADANTEMAISGDAVITDNEANGKANNLYIGSNSCNTVAVGEMKNGASIGVTLKSSSGGVFTNAGAAYAECFESDDPAYTVAVDGENLKLIKTPAEVPNVQVSDDLVLTYGEYTGQKFTATVEKKDGYTYVYQWIQGHTVIGNADTFTIPDDLGAGNHSYYLAVGAKRNDNGEIAWYTNGNLRVTVNPKALGDTNVALSQDTFTYNGNEQKPAVTVTVGGKTLTENTDYILSWSADCTSAGSKTVTVTFKGNYSGEVTKNFEIEKADISGVQIILSEDAFTYNGQAQKPEVTVTFNGKTLTTADYELYFMSADTVMQWEAGRPVKFFGKSQSDSINANTYYAVVYGKGNFVENSSFAYAEYSIAQKELGIVWSNTTLTYNGAAQQPIATATGVVAGEQIALTLGAPATNAGTYTATVRSIDGETAQNYKLPTNQSTSFTIEQQALTILWGNGIFTYDSTEKFPAFNVEGIWNADDVQVTKAGAQTNAGEYTAQITGLTGADAGNYKLTGTLTKDFVINKADQAAPAVNKVDETISGKNDGTITDVTANMEYRSEDEDSYTAITGETVENLADGKYYVRVKGDSNHNPSADTAVVIGAGRKLTITLPQNQAGYTVSATATELDWMGNVTITVELQEGYSKTEDFKYLSNGIDLTDSHMLDGKTVSYSGVIADITVVIKGVADITAPSAQIDIQNNKWTSFWNGVTFGLFFKETQDVAITATNSGSGVSSIQYYLASGELELEEVKQIPVWQDYSGTFQINPDNEYVVYAKIKDNAGNIVYLNSDGVVLDQTVPVLVGIENGGSYYGDKRFKALDDYLDTLKVDGVDVTDEMNGDNEYTIVADNAEHTVTVTDKAENVTEYKITVYKNYTVTYKVDGNTVSTQTIGHGKDTTAPEIPAKEGYTQTAPTWDKDGKNITADTEINAVYTINKYTVTYKADGNVVGTVEVEHGKDATAPAIPEKEGYTKIAPIWDKDGKNITADTEINAVYTINEYTITFKDENGVYKTLTVKHGEAVTMPAVPVKEDHTVTWDTTIDKATAGVTVNAVYTKNPTPNEPQTPQTGDNSNFTLWWILLLVSVAGVTTLCVVQRKRTAA